MVNSNRLTVSPRRKKLSRLQKLILQILEEEGGSMALYELAAEVASKYQIRETEETRRYREEFMRLVEERGLSYLLNMGRDPPPNRLWGARGKPVFESKFKAIFYRSVKRLEKRGLIKKRWDYFYDEEVGKRYWYKVVELVKED